MKCERCNGTGEGEGEHTIGGDGYGNRCCGTMDVPNVCEICEGTGVVEDDDNQRKE